MAYSKKILDYKERMKSFVKRTFPNLTEEEIDSRLDDIIEDRNCMKDNIEIGLKFFDQKSNAVKNVNINKLELNLDKRNPIITKYGTCFVQHKEHEALENLMLIEAGELRKINKKKKFEHINDEDPTLMNRYDGIQQTYKASIMNSYYGVMTAQGSIFRDLDCGESVTAQGEDIIMTAIDTFERFLANNVHFYSPNDVITYIENIVHEEYKFEDKFKFNITKEELINYLNEHFYDKETLKDLIVDLNDYPFIIDYIDNLTDLEVQKVFYKNNLLQFLNDSKLYKKFELILENVDNPFMDPNKPSDEQNEILEEVWNYVKEWVFYNFIDYNKFNFCHKGKRKVVLVVDTDSNFLYLYPTYKFLADRIDCVDDRKIMKVGSVNCFTFLITKVINEAYLKFGGLHNIEEKYRPLTNMKNELLLSRLLMTKNKKNYADSILMQEGNLIEKPKIDLKGLAIKKSNTNKLVGEYFTNLLKDNVILTDEIKYSTIIRKYFDLIDVIKNSLVSGQTDFLTPSRANELNSYDKAPNIMAIRAILLWNILYKEDEIILPTNVNLCKVVIEPDINLIENKIRTYFEENELDLNEDELKEFLKRMESAINYKFVTNHNNKNEKVEIENALIKKGLINIIAIPKNMNEIPIFIRPFINIDKICYDHLNVGTIILDSLDIQTPSINDSLVPTNIIKI